MESTNNATTANGNDDDDGDDVQLVKIVDGDAIQEFRHQNHSLGINASSVAACVGYHEFQSIPELMLKHVYQGRGGQRLLEHDAQLLGLELTSRADEEAELLKLAESSGSETVLTAVTRALKVKHGEKLRSVDDANVLKQTVAKELTTQEHNLTLHQLQLLKEGTRQAIDTGCGHSWEEEALDRYQEQCGWEVRERNAECRVWHFEKTNGNTNAGDESDGDDQEDSNSSTNTDSDNSNNNNNNNNNNMPSIRPIAPARARDRVNYKASSNTNDDNNNKNNNQRYDSRGVKRKLPSSYDSQITETALMDLTIPAASDFGSDSAPTKRIMNNTDGKEQDGDDIMVTIEGSSATDAILIDGDDEDNFLRHHHNRRPQNDTMTRSRPFVTIKGMVDGIRDELGPTTRPSREGGTKESEDTEETKNDDDDDLSCDSFSLSRVVVECKHRMRALLPNGPRFSECIQAVVYCFMYEADEADIVQVLRRSKPKHNTKLDSKKEAREQHSGPLLTDIYKKSSPIDGKSTANVTAKKENGDAIEEGTDKDNSKEIGSAFATTDGEGDANENTNIVAVAAAAATKTINQNDTKDTIDTSDVTMKIAVDRVSLDDPQFGHRANWKAIILPKLRQWVDAVYEIRQSDDKRYRLLTTLSMMAAVDNSDSGNGNDTANGEQQQQSRKDHAKAAWELVFEECDFLREGMSGERYRIETR